jgi:hypothetical protein
MSMRFHGLAGFGNGSLTGKGTFDPQQRRGAMSITVLGTNARLLFDGAVFYVQGGAPGLNADTWVKFDLPALAHDPSVPRDVAKAFGQLGKQFKTFDPSGPFDYLRVVQNVTTVGTESVRGVETTHYRSTFDSRGEIARLPAQAREQITKALGEDAFAAAPIEVWIDGHGLLRRLQASFGGNKGFSMKEELYDYGVAVDVSTPPAGAIVDASQLFKEGYTG